VTHHLLAKASHLSQQQSMIPMIHKNSMPKWIEYIKHSTRFYGAGNRDA